VSVNRDAAERNESSSEDLAFITRANSSNAIRLTKNSSYRSAKIANDHSSFYTLLIFLSAFAARILFIEIALVPSQSPIYRDSRKMKLADVRIYLLASFRLYRLREGSRSLEICNAKTFTVSVPVISVRDASKPLLASCVPYLQLDRRLVDGDNFVLQGYDVH